MNFFLAALITVLSFTVMAQEKTKAEKPFFIHERSNKITRADIRKDQKATGNTIQIDAVNASGGASTASRSTVLPPAEITSVNIVNGSYNQTRELSKSGRGMSMQLLDVVYPCRVRLTVSEQIIDLEIREPGFWKVSLGLIN